MKEQHYNVYEGDKFAGTFSTGELAKFLGIQRDSVFDIIKRNPDRYRGKYLIELTGSIEDRAPDNFFNTWPIACAAAKEGMIKNGRYTGKYDNVKEKDRDKKSTEENESTNWKRRFLETFLKDSMR